MKTLETVVSLSISGSGQKGLHRNCVKILEILRGGHYVIHINQRGDEECEGKIPFKKDNSDDNMRNERCPYTLKEKLYTTNPFKSTNKVVMKWSTPPFTTDTNIYRQPAATLFPLSQSPAFIIHFNTHKLFIVTITTLKTSALLF